MWFTANDWNDWQTAYLASHNQAGGIVATSPQVITGINDSNNNQVLGISPTTSAVNALTAKNSATGNAVQLQATGSDTNIGLTMTSKGSGNITLTAGSSGVVSTNSPTLALNSNPVWQYLGSVVSATTASTASTSVVALSALTVPVTIPTGVTKVRVSVIFPQMFGSGSLASIVNVWRGTVGSGTALPASEFQVNANPLSCSFFSLDTPSAGAVTYNVGWYVGAGTIYANGTGAAVTMLVECC